MDRIARIKSMEKKLDASLRAVRAFERALERYLGAQEDIRVLEAYFTGSDWREDFAADEQGLLPPSLKRGVLSEDGVDPLLEENGALRRRLAELL